MKSKFLFPAIAMGFSVLLLARHRADAMPDVVSSASLVVSPGSITGTSVVLNITHDKYDYGTRTLCYDPSPTTPTHNCVTKTVTSNLYSFTVTGLTPATKYNFNIKAIDTQGGEKSYSTSGSFTTNGIATGIVIDMSQGKAKVVPGMAAACDASGRTLPRNAVSSVRKVFTEQR